MLFTVVFLAMLAWYVLVPPDVVTLDNQAGADSPVLLLDGSRWGCVDDEVRRGVSVGVGNLTPDASCLSEIAVFSQDNAMNMVTPIDTWTSAGGDVLKVNQQGLLKVPLTIWTLTGLPADAVVHASRAAQIFNLMQVGLEFTLDPRDFHTQTRINTAACEDLAPLVSAFVPVAKRINVYYVPRVTMPLASGPPGTTIDVNGRWCSDDPDIVLIGTFQPETLAHELGHAFTLGHIDGTGLPASNLMYSGAVRRDSVSTGQAFRVNVNTQSRVNKNGVRSGPTRDCPDGQADNRCPALTLDVVPK